MRRHRRDAEEQLVLLDERVGEYSQRMMQGIDEFCTPLARGLESTAADEP